MLEKLEEVKFNFTSYLHCPRCGTGMLFIDNKSVSCPECEILRDLKVPNVERSRPVISQEIF